MIRSHEFYFVTSCGTSLYEKEIPLLKMINVYSAVSKNFQQELTTGCGQICVSSFTTTLEQKNSKKFTRVEQSFTCCSKDNGCRTGKYHINLLNYCLLHIR